MALLKEKQLTMSTKNGSLTEEESQRLEIEKAALHDQLNALVEEKEKQRVSY